MATKPRSCKATTTSAACIDRVTDYARAVVSGSVVAGPHVRDACARHLRDLEEGPKRGLFFDLVEANRAINFYKDILRLNGGEFEGQPYELLDWQAFIVGSIFGWKGADGYRRFRVAYIETAKGSGKSPLAAGAGLYGMMADGEPGAEIYAAATKKDQAMILFRDAVAMVDQSPQLAARLLKSGGAGNVWNLSWIEKRSFFRPIAADDGQSGPRPHFSLLDEIHEHKSAYVVEMLKAGQKGRRQPLMFMITNSGTDKRTVCWDYHDFGAKVCAGQIEDDSFFGYICALDEGDDPFKDPSCWGKANPSLGITIPLRYLEDQVKQARGMPSKESIVRRLNFCQWVEAESPWIAGHTWMACQEEDFHPDQLLGRRCFGGLDLSSTQDLTAFVLLFEPVEDDPVWRLVPRFWLPADGLHEKADKDRVPYIAWRDAGYLQTTPGRAISKAHVLRDIAEACSLYDVVAIAYDRWRIEDFKALMDVEGISLPLVPWGQGFKDMGPAVNEFETLFINVEGTTVEVQVAADATEQLRHDGNPVMTWCAANAVLVSDPAGNRKVAKDKATGRVDGIVAAVMAAGVAKGKGDDALVIDSSYELLAV